MIWHPKAGQKARIHYRKIAAPEMPFHGLVGTIRTAGKGPGPINALVEIGPLGTFIVIPRGNLVKVESVTK